ncbi:hypothetical protein [Rhodococcus sp. IEGM 1408]|uniref:hypothetical protein n=1 Tax=Rhodococcus sp. IEGM 1408 TaxID=3082220 RepID=UPI002955AF76|nr:hypothetical protein [Rhodococcus sp. IEGM 1408]MDV8002662.1 hypothetical protein [Rhodococcus sp. IEGM 1408]
MSTPGPSPLPGPDVAELRSAFDDLLADSVAARGDDGEVDGAVRDHQVEALDAAHELLAQALTALDAAR